VVPVRNDQTQSVVVQRADHAACLNNHSCVATPGALSSAKAALSAPDATFLKWFVNGSAPGMSIFRVRPATGCAGQEVTPGTHVRSLRSAHTTSSDIPQNARQSFHPGCEASSPTRSPSPVAGQVMARSTGWSGEKHRRPAAIPQEARRDLVVNRAGS
jgi:hypothetical protein